MSDQVNQENVKVFDFHFHLLFKHAICKGFKLEENVTTKGFAKLLNEIFGGPFDSQSSPKQLSESRLFVGVVAILSLEHAFANRILHLLGLDLSSALPLKKDLVMRTKNGETNYFAEFNEQLKFHIDQEKALGKIANVTYLHRKNFKTKTLNEIVVMLSDGVNRYLAFSIEGGHNLSDVPIRKGVISRNPELNLKKLQDDASLDFISINLCHLSHIPEQPLGGFAQGLNSLSQIAFYSEDFMPKMGLGLSELGKKVVRQALTHAEHPVIIDLKHMSVYSRFHYYRYREKLITENANVARLPIISSHTGFVFDTIADYIKNKKFQSQVGSEGMVLTSKVESENKRIGNTDDKHNDNLFCNPWTINLFDEEIVEIMLSKGMIGISFDQRVLGASKAFLDGTREKKYFEAEYIAYPEWERLFRDGQLPGAEGLFDFLKVNAPSRPERHIMLLCLHIVYAVRVGYASLSWLEGTSPWDHICIGSDYDGLINPINGYDTIADYKALKQMLLKYLPQADKSLLFYKDKKALEYNADGTVKSAAMAEFVDRFMFKNGVNFMGRFLKNWNA